LGDVTVLCAASACEEAAETAAKLTGVSKVLCCSDAAFGHDLADSRVRSMPEMRSKL